MNLLMQLSIARGIASAEEDWVSGFQKFELHYLFSHIPTLFVKIAVFVVRIYKAFSITKKKWKC